MGRNSPNLDRDYASKGRCQVKGPKLEVENEKDTFAGLLGRLSRLSNRFQQFKKPTPEGQRDSPMGSTLAWHVTYQVQFPEFP